MTNSLTGSGTKQGDHVFNDLKTAIERPLDSMRNARVEGLEGDHFLTDFLPRGRDLARRILRDPIWATVREYVATPGQEHDAVTRLRRIAPNRALLTGLTELKLVQTHLQNAGRFGEEARRFELEFLRAMLHALTVATERPDSPDNSNLIFAGGSPVMAFQALVSAAFDPAAALVLVMDRADKENALGQASVLNLIEAVWKTLDPPRPALWAETWNQFRDARPPGLAKVVHDIAGALQAFSMLKVTGQSEILLTLSEVAAGRKAGISKDNWLQQYGYMIAALTTRTQQLQSSARA